MARNGIRNVVGNLFMVLSILISLTATHSVAAQSPTPTMLHPQLNVRTVTSGLTTPTTMAFLSDTEFFVLEKNTGKV